mgnify:CR=1 FL=1
MNALPQTTMRRLKKIPQNSSVWEGDRRPLSGVGSDESNSPQDNRECIIWVDAVEGQVRAMDVVPAEMGLEAVVRTLLRGIENPHGPAKPSRPQKIIVQNREIQFFLRGAIQDLDINVDYVPELPLIDELFRTFEFVEEPSENQISPHSQQLLQEIANEIWEESPWDLLADHDIVALSINRWDITTLYACVMGMLGKKYGVILYRSLESMKQFRSAVLSEESLGHLENAFLGQDCWFLSYEPAPDEFDFDEDDDDFDLADLPNGAIMPMYGSVHPLEGIRPIQEEEEAKAIYLGLKALLQFYRSSTSKLSKDTIEAIEKRHRVTIPLGEDEKETVLVTVATMPEVTDELLEMLEEAELSQATQQQGFDFPINHELMLEEAIYRLDVFSAELINKLTERTQTYVQDQENCPTGDLPIFLIQTSRPKAQSMIETIQQAGGLKGICFTKGEDSFAEISYDLAIAQTNDGELYLIGEFFADEDEDEDEDESTLLNWHQAAVANQRNCGIVIAMGITGNAAGDPQLKDMLALFPVELLDPEELGIGVLELNFGFSFEEE